MPAAAYLQQHPALAADAEGVVELVYNEVLLRQERGETPQLTEYLAQLPQLSSPLRRLFEVYQALGSPSLFPSEANRETPPPSSDAGTLSGAPPLLDCLLSPATSC